MITRSAAWMLLAASRAALRIIAAVTVASSGAIMSPARRSTPRSPTAYVTRWLTRSRLPGHGSISLTWRSPPRPPAGAAWIGDRLSDSITVRANSACSTGAAATASGERPSLPSSNGDVRPRRLALDSERGGHADDAAGSSRLVHEQRGWWVLVVGEALCADGRHPFVDESTRRVLTPSLAGLSASGMA